MGILAGAKVKQYLLEKVKYYSFSLLFIEKFFFSFLFQVKSCSTSTRWKKLSHILLFISWCWCYWERFFFSKI